MTWPLPRQTTDFGLGLISSAFPVLFSNKSNVSDGLNLGFLFHLTNHLSVTEIKNALDIRALMQGTAQVYLISLHTFTINRLRKNIVDPFLDAV